MTYYHADNLSHSKSRQPFNYHRPYRPYVRLRTYIRTYMNTIQQSITLLITLVKVIKIYITPCLLYLIQLEEFGQPVYTGLELGHISA